MSARRHGRTAGMPCNQQGATLMAAFTSAGLPGKIKCQLVKSGTWQQIPRPP